MEIFLPTLESKMVALVSAFRFIVFAIMVVGLIAFASSPRTGSTGLFTVLAKSDRDSRRDRLHGFVVPKS
jgi:hypothetical protein